jgi:phospholipase C
MNSDIQAKPRVRIVDNAYKSSDIIKEIAGTTKNTKTIISASTHAGWYDFSVFVEGNNLFEKRYAGRVETGKHSISDPVMGGTI